MSDTVIIVSAGLGAGLFALTLALPGFALVASHRRDRKRWATPPTPPTGDRADV